MTVPYDERHPCLILCQVKGSVWLQVLPYCFLNCALTCAFAYAANNGLVEVKDAINPQGHGLVGLLVSFLVINKMYLALDRYMLARSALGHAFANLRELYQTALVFTAEKHFVGEDDDKKAFIMAVEKWRSCVRDKIIDVLDCTARVLKDDRKAIYLSRNEVVPIGSCWGKKKLMSLNTQAEDDYDDDPMMYTQILRSHVWNSRLPLELLEKIKLTDSVNGYLYAYRDLLKLASTPLPFPMIQMGRTFLFLWIFSMPLALAGLDFHLGSVIIFVFFLTYGYVGLELVAMKLLHPFGDDVNDLNVTGMRDATIRGMTNDCNVLVLDGTTTIAGTTVKTTPASFVYKRSGRSVSAGGRGGEYKLMDSQGPEHAQDGGGYHA